MKVGTRLDAALSEADRARHIDDFSTAVAKHDKRLRAVDRQMFLQKVAADFQTKFVADIEDGIRAGKSWGYAATCNAVSRQDAGQAGIRRAILGLKIVFFIDSYSLNQPAPCLLTSPKITSRNSSEMRLVPIRFDGAGLDRSDPPSGQMKRPPVGATLSSAHDAGKD
ncbi:hypothetical protein [Bradyrhizobium sp. NAS96.2]|uniref:hypothetical protein n=1 Tax=Bradyrhizobium sp. NAS96.2 TaxID=1680160 RepID=UPI0011614AE7|nr:hypothetical protein [Bradyrhizobium sp. NAS96.2]